MFEIGDRVKVRKSYVHRFLQPWRSRFKAGRAGTVVGTPSANIRGFMVEWDHGKVKYPHEWRMVHRSDELVRTI